MRIKYSIPAALMIAAAVGQSAHSAGIAFSANVDQRNACLILVDSNGTLAQNASGSVLSSRLPGGSAGSARVISVWNYDVTVAGGNAWADSPINDHMQTDFEPFFTGTSIVGGVNFPQREGLDSFTLPRRLTITRITVDLDATSQTGSFPSGDYTKIVTLRCD